MVGTPAEREGGSDKVYFIYIVYELISEMKCMPLQAQSILFASSFVRSIKLGRVAAAAAA